MAVRISLRRLLAGLSAGGIFLVVAALLQPYPRGEEGATYCLPWLGPRTTISPDLSDTARPRVAAHESVHAAQCRAQGSWRIMTARWSPSRRLALEAAAGCAEARWSRDRGRRSDFAFEQLVDELTYDVPRGLAPDPGAARVAATAACPELAAEAGHREATTIAPGPR